MKLAPVDDKLIRIRHPLSLDPEGMLLASILGKKKSVGAEYVLIDIPVGRGVKVPYIERGNDLARHFLQVGVRLGMKIEALITDGAEPVGNGIGPGLECVDVLQVLGGKGPDDLRHKSLLMAGKLLELCGKVDNGQGYSVAEDLLIQRESHEEVPRDNRAPGREPESQGVRHQDRPVHSTSSIPTSAGSIFHIDNKTMSKIARIAGAPRDKGAGVLLHRVRGDRVEKGDMLFTIYAESESSWISRSRRSRTSSPWR